MTAHYDVIVTGAGPAGTMAARFLAKGGARTLLLEKEKLPRYKICGGGVVWRAREAAELDISAIAEREFRKVDWIFRDDLKFTVAREYPIVTMVMRDRLDYLMAESAVTEGADLHDMEELKSLEINSGQRIRVITDKGNYTCNHLVACDGLRSTVLKFLNLEDARLKIPAIEAEIKVAKTDGPLFEHVVFDVSAIQYGYGWIFPKEDHLSVGIAAMPGKGVSLRKAYRNYLAHTGIDNIMISEKQYGYQIPLHPHRNLWKGNILLAGDAAGLADPLVAEGISHAIISGKTAALAILEQPEAAGAAYELKMKKMRKQIRSAYWFSKLFYDHPGLCTLALRSKGQYITEYVSDIFGGSREYPDNPGMIGKSLKRLIF